ncbi:hypothetical protein, partial [Parafilimonas sp.]|uniref:hypothetical protein n=1 Tax=Parafilimonas sp. TaxID=1969739 RepID=UPI0039E2CC83
PQMSPEHVISDALFEQAMDMLLKRDCWIAYNTIPYFLDKGDMYFFTRYDEACEFSQNNISEYDNYKVIHADSLSGLLQQISYGEIEQFVNSKKLSIMNENNYDYLSNQLKYTGFGEGLQEQLKEKMQQQEPQFTLTVQKEFGKDQTTAMLQFRKSEESDMYFFNRYNVALKNDQHSDAIKQTFYINPKSDSITLKEPYNLLNGRSVHKELTTKEGEKYKAWLQLDFKESDANGNFKIKSYHENYGYDLQAVLQKHPIKELSDPDSKSRLIESLERGNRQSVTLTIQGKEQKVFVEAVLQFKSLNFYEASGQRIRSDKLYENNSQEQSAKKENKQSMKPGGDDEGEGFDTGQKKAKRKRQNIT